MSNSHFYASCNGQTGADGKIKFPDDVAGCTGFPMGRCTVSVFFQGRDVFIGYNECNINEHGQLVELTAQLPPPDPGGPGGPGDGFGDILEVDIGSGNAVPEGTPIVIVAVVYDNLPSPSDGLFEGILPPEIVFELDLDQNPSTGMESEIDFLTTGTPGETTTGLGVDLKVRCGEPSGSPTACRATGGDGTDFGMIGNLGFNFAEDKVIFFIPVEIVELALQNCVGGTGTLPVTANAALLSLQDSGLQSLGPLIGDVVPNAGSFEADIGGLINFPPLTPVSDPSSDTFPIIDD